jgi:hypothetical protein
MRCIVLYRINGGVADAVQDESGEITEFADMDAAIAYCRGNPLFASGQAVYQIVELYEL